MKKTIFLSGFMGCGKSGTGKRAAELTNLQFIDLDSYIEKKAEKTIVEIFSQHGEKHFRELETVAIGFLCENQIHNKDAIVALGGGAIVSPVNAAIINRLGVSVFIDADFEVCFERIKNDLARPLIQGKPKSRLQDFFNQRRQIYLAHCRQIVDGNNDIDTIAKEIAAIYANL
jgi:shikimate kinase